MHDFVKKANFYRKKGFIASATRDVINIDAYFPAVGPENDG